MSTKTYNRLRYITQIVLPALATFLITVCGVWDIDYGERIGTTISAIVTLLSGILGASSAIYDKEGGKKDANSDGDTPDILHKRMYFPSMASTDIGDEEE